MLDQPIACVDVETTGTSPQHDRITEIGVVEMDPDGSVREWSTLVNPQTLIPPFIEQLTGISNAMVEAAPTFAQVASELRQRLSGRLFVAHNVRFDYAFVWHEFQRLDTGFRADTLCTVRLSRRLYPQHYKHNLDSLIARLGLQVENRHRALADARVLAAFLQQLPREHDAATIADAVRHVMAKPALPAHLPEGLIDDIPDAPGVYLFLDDNDLPLFIGKSKRLHTSVLSHFTGSHRSSKELRIQQQLKRIEWRETAGELGTLLLEARLIKQLQPAHNLRSRQENGLCSWQMLPAPNGGQTLALKHAADTDFASTPQLYGMFASERKALQTLRELADAHRLCLIQLGLEKPARGKPQPCFGHQQQKCAGVCVGKEMPSRHDLRLMEALARLKLQSWPHAGPVGIRESYAGREEMHVLDRWRYLGSARDEAELATLLNGADTAPFDPDIYKLLAKRLHQLAVVPLVRSADLADNP